MPGSNGCTLVYYLVIKKIFKHYEDTIDSYVIKTKDYANDMFNNNNIKNIKNIKNLSSKNYKNNDKDENNKEDSKEKEHYE